MKTPAVISEIENLQSRKDKILANKLDELELERFSISSFNSFRTNRFTWYLRYVLGFHSQYPMESAWRGQAIETAIDSVLLGSSLSMDEIVQRAIESYHGKLLEKLFQVYPKTVDGFEKDSISKMLRGLPKDQFPEKLKLIVDTHFKINEGEKLPGYLIPDHPDYAKYLRKVESQYSLIEESIPVAVEYFVYQKHLNPGFTNQRRIKASPDHYGIAIPTIGYTDYEFDEFGLDLKTCDPKMLPKSWDKVKWNYKCQAAFYSAVTGKPWKIVYVSKLSSDAKKINLICELAKKGLYLDEIPKAYKEINGTGTTKPTVEKILAEHGNRDPIRAFQVFDLPMEEVEQYENLNRVTAQSILKMVSACKKDTFLEDMKYHCLGDIEQLFLKPDEIKKIEEVWGIRIGEQESEVLDAA